MNISLIHSFELMAFLLMLGVVFQIRKLYRQSSKTPLSTKKRFTKEPASQAFMPHKSNRTDLHKSNNLYNRLKENYSHYGLPLAEVSFSEELPLPEVSYSDHEKPESKHKAILNSYIEDFFIAPSPAVYHDAEIVEFKQYQSEPNLDDEYIIVADEHDEMLRAYDSLAKSAC